MKTKLADQLLGEASIRRVAMRHPKTREWQYDLLPQFEKHVNPLAAGECYVTVRAVRNTGGTTKILRGYTRVKELVAGVATVGGYAAAIGMADNGMLIAYDVDGNPTQYTGVVKLPVQPV